MAKRLFPDPATKGKVKAHIRKTKTGKLAQVQAFQRGDRVSHSKLGHGTVGHGGPGGFAVQWDNPERAMRGLEPGDKEALKKVESKPGTTKVYRHTPGNPGIIKQAAKAFQPSDPGTRAYLTGKPMPPTATTGMSEPRGGIRQAGTIKKSGHRHSPGNPLLTGDNPRKVGIKPGQSVRVGKQKGVYLGQHEKSKGLHHVSVRGKKGLYAGQQVYRHTPNNPGFFDVRKTGKLS